MEISVNGNIVVTSLDFPPTGSWEMWSTSEVSIYLNDGINSLRITSLSDEGAPNLDKVDISFQGVIFTPEPTPTPTPGPTPVSGSYDTVIGWGRNTTGGSGGIHNIWCCAYF